MKNVLSIIVATLLLSTNANAIIKVAVLDSGLENKDGRYNSVLCSQHKDFTGEGLSDTLGHGTAVAGLIRQHAVKNNYCLMIVKYYSAKQTNRINGERFLAALEWALGQGASFINVSGGGSSYSEQEERLIIGHPATMFIVAAGNEGEALGRVQCSYYPACYPEQNLFVVGAVDASGDIWEGSNYGDKVDFWNFGVDVVVDGKLGSMTGTSASTAIMTGILLNRKN